MSATAIMPNHRIQMIEVFSAKQEQDVYKLELGITCDDELVYNDLLIDEFTYKQLRDLGAFGRGRLRLSTYSKWDPFRKLYYSSLVRTHAAFHETLYFTCSEFYMTQLNQLLQRDFSRIRKVEVPSAVEASVKRHRISKPTRTLALRTLVISVLMFIFVIRMDEKLFINQADDLSPHANAATPYNTPPLIHNDELAPQPQTAEQTIAEEPVKPAYEIIEVDPEDKGLYRVPKGYVALSFDDGPSAYTQKIVDILKEHQVAATFLFVGKNALQHPEAVTYAAEHGMSVGNHSWDHSDLAKKDPSVQLDNLNKASSVLESLTGSPIKLVRPPYGSVNEALTNNVKKQQWKMLMWNRDPQDWRARSPKDILRYMHDADPSGGIYVLHETSITVEALPEIIQYVKEKSLKFAIFK